MRLRNSIFVFSSLLICSFFSTIIFGKEIIPIAVAEAAANPYQLAKGHSVSINIDTPWGGRSTIGSGTLVKTSNMGLIILTAEHVALAVPFPMVACSMNDEEDCVELGMNPVVDIDDSIITDWALYQLDDNPFYSVSPARINSRGLELGDDTYMAGMPFGLGPWMSEGSIANIHGSGTDGESLYMMNGFAHSGFSGGGVFDKRGRLHAITVAIATSEWGPQENQIFAVPIHNIGILNL